MVRAMARLRAERLVALVMEGIAVELDRADVAAGLLLQARPFRLDTHFSLANNQVDPGLSLSLRLLVRVKGGNTGCSLLQSAQAEDPLHGILFLSNDAAESSLELHLLLFTPNLKRQKLNVAGMVLYFAERSPETKPIRN